MSSFEELDHACFFVISLTIACCFSLLRFSVLAYLAPRSALADLTGLAWNKAQSLTFIFPLLRSS